MSVCAAGARSTPRPRRSRGPWTRAGATGRAGAARTPCAGIRHAPRRPPVVGDGVPEDMGSGADRHRDRGQQPESPASPARGRARSRRTGVRSTTASRTSMNHVQRDQPEDDIDRDPPAAVGQPVAHADRQVHRGVRRESTRHQRGAPAQAGPDRAACPVTAILGRPARDANDPPEGGPCRWTWGSLGARHPPSEGRESCLDPRRPSSEARARSDSSRNTHDVRPCDQSVIAAGNIRNANHLVSFPASPGSTDGNAAPLIVLEPSHVVGDSLSTRSWPAGQAR